MDSKSDGTPQITNKQVEAFFEWTDLDIEFTRSIDMLRNNMENFTYKEFREKKMEICKDYVRRGSNKALEHQIWELSFYVDSPDFQTLLDRVNKNMGDSNLSEMYVRYIVDIYGEFDEKHHAKTLFVLCHGFNKERECKKLKQENSQLKERISELEDQLSYQPDGDGYLDVQKHFIQTARPRRKSI